jgi:U3 small nucleolar RNA-associated protein 6
MEEMIPELEALEHSGYFSKAELKSIVSQRQQFEYALKRKAVIKRDYLKYIEYECKLDRLRILRKKEKKIEGKESIASSCFIRRVHFIFERALRKFKGDLSLWKAWVDYCRESGSGRQASKVLARAVQLHPTCSALWVQAAAWEFDHNANAAAARALMQRGLRICKNSPELWHEYFRMELLYCLRLRERRVVLGLEKAQGIDEALINGTVALVVYKNAVKEVSSNRDNTVTFRTKFLEILNEYQFEGRHSIEQAIYNSIFDSYKDEPVVWDLRARREMQVLLAQETRDEEEIEIALQAALVIYDQAVDYLRCAQMTLLSLAFVQEQLDLAVCTPLKPISLRRHARIISLGRKAVKLIEEAAAAQYFDEKLALQWPMVYLKLGDIRGAILAARYASGLVENSPSVWKQLLSLESVVLNKVNLPSLSQSQLGNLVLQALKSAPLQHETQTIDLWLTAIQILKASPTHLKELCMELISQQSSKSQGPVENGSGIVGATLLVAIHNALGLKHFRKLYSSVLKVPPCGGELYHSIIDIELSLWSCSPECLKYSELEKVFQQAIFWYGQSDSKLWEKYSEWMELQGKGCGKVTWLAKNRQVC